MNLQRNCLIIVGQHFKLNIPFYEYILRASNKALNYIDNIIILNDINNDVLDIENYILQSREKMVKFSLDECNDTDYISVFKIGQAKLGFGIYNDFDIITVYFKYDNTVYSRTMSENEFKIRSINDFTFDITELVKIFNEKQDKIEKIEYQIDNNLKTEPAIPESWEKLEF